MDIRKRRELGARIRQERLKHNWDIPTLAERSSIPARRLVMLEEGAADLSTRQLIQLASAFQTTADSLLYDQPSGHTLCATPDIEKNGKQILQDIADIIQHE